jgi:hypothetical protein
MWTKRSRAIFATFVFCTIIVAPAQEPALTDLETQASIAYSHQQWDKAEPLYAELAHAHPDNAHLWYRYAMSARSDHHYDVALQAFGEAKRTGTGKGLPAFVVDYDIATVQAAMGHANEAFATLKSAATGGFAQPDRLEKDMAWNGLRTDARYTPALEQIKRNYAPCRYSPENRQFDFWLGDWDVVTTEGGTPAGTSHIADELNGCVIWENWTSMGSPYAGKSYNMYNTGLKRWEQFWVDNSAGMMFFYGNLKAGVMDFWTDNIPQPDGTSLKRHLQFFNISPDTVRQFSQKSTDDGKTWTLDYDFTYHRHKS